MASNFLIKLLRELLALEFATNGVAHFLGGSAASQVAGLPLPH